MMIRTLLAMAAGVVVFAAYLATMAFLMTVIGCDDAYFWRLQW